MALIPPRYAMVVPARTEQANGSSMRGEDMARIMRSVISKQGESSRELGDSLPQVRKEQADAFIGTLSGLTARNLVRCAAGHRHEARPNRTNEPGVVCGKHAVHADPECMYACGPGTDGVGAPNPAGPAVSTRGTLCRTRKRSRRWRSSAARASFP